MELVGTNQKCWTQVWSCHVQPVQLRGHLGEQVLRCVDIFIRGNTSGGSPDSKMMKLSSLLKKINEKIKFIYIGGVFRSARTSYRAFNSRPPVRPSTRANFSWVHRWAVKLPSDLRDPSYHTFFESPWCQLSNFGQNFKYRDKYKGKYRDKYKDRDKWREKLRHLWCDIFLKKWWQKDSEYGICQEGS